jgi:hypothetical protein
MKRKPGLPVWSVSLGPPIASIGVAMLPGMLLLLLMLCKDEELARTALRRTREYAKERAGYA